MGTRRFRGDLSAKDIDGFLISVFLEHYYEHNEGERSL